MGIREWFEKTLLKKYAASIIRHLLTALAGYLISRGIVDVEESEIFISTNFEVLLGSVVYLFGQTWSFKEKRSKLNVS